MRIITAETFLKNLRYILPLVIILGGFITYSVMFAQWQNPTAGPTGSNVLSPIDMTNRYQIKQGDLGAMKMRAGQYCDESGTVCISTATSTGSSNGSNPKFLGFFTAPDTTITVPAGTKSLIITPSASAACQLPGNSASGVGLTYRANGTPYAFLRSDSGNNNRGLVSIAGASNGVVDVQGQSSVSLSVTKNTFKSNFASHANGAWSSNVLCPSGVAMQATFFGYSIVAVDSFTQSSYVNNTPAYTYSWQPDDWGACTLRMFECNGTETRTYYCERSDGVVSPDSSCPAPKPANGSRGCTPTWLPSNCR